MSAEKKSSNRYEALIEDISDVKEAVKRPENWPPCKPILRHSIREDIPLELQTMVRFMLSDCFYTAFVLVFNFVVVLITYFVHNEDLLFNDLIFSFIWFVVWTIGCFVVYSCLYMAISKQSRRYYVAFNFGLVADVIVSVIATMGLSNSGVMSFGYVISGAYGPLFRFLSFITTIALTLNVIFLVAYFFVIRSKYKSVILSNRIVIEDCSAIASRIGAYNSLPSEIDGREIRYLPLSAGTACDSKVEKLNTLPEGSFTVISGWKKMDNNPEHSYILYVENDPERAYWSNAQVAGMLNNGVVNPVTQMLTVSRLPGGSFVFGVMEKDKKEGLD